MLRLEIGRRIAMPTAKNRNSRHGLQNRRFAAPYWQARHLPCPARRSCVSPPAIDGSFRRPPAPARSALRAEGKRRARIKSARPRPAEGAAPQRQPLCRRRPRLRAP